MIAVEREVAAPPVRVFDFLADLRNHWRLERRFLELEGRAWFEGLFRRALDNLDTVA